MAKSKDTNKRITRWFLELQDYNFEVEHKPGKDIPHADALSRLYEEERQVCGPAANLTGGMCGGSFRHRPPGRPCTSEKRTLDGRARPSRAAHYVGQVIEGRYMPAHTLHQAQAYAPVGYSKHRLHK